MDLSCSSASFKSNSSTLTATPAWWKTKLAQKLIRHTLRGATARGLIRPTSGGAKPLNHLNQVFTLVLLEDLVSGSRLFLNTLQIVELEHVELKVKTSDC